MKKKSILMLITSAILVAGVVIAGCTQDSASVSQQSGDTSDTSAVQTLTTSLNSQMNDIERPAFNQTGAPNGTPPSGMMMNGTRPSGTPPDGMMNGTRPSGTPPDGMMVSTPPSGTPPSGS
ncbi:MAG: hypothetical protein M0Q91_13075 [Methanoregula sp.]|nr:hypothetical protein [Methanoregula sp.]